MTLRMALLVPRSRHKSSEFHKLLITSDEPEKISVETLLDNRRVSEPECYIPCTRIDRILFTKYMRDSCVCVVLATITPLAIEWGESVLNRWINIVFSSKNCCCPALAFGWCALCPLARPPLRGSQQTQRTPEQDFSVSSPPLCVLFSGGLSSLPLLSVDANGKHLIYFLVLPTRHVPYFHHCSITLPAACNGTCLYSTALYVQRGIKGSWRVHLVCFRAPNGVVEKTSMLHGHIWSKRSLTNNCQADSIWWRDPDGLGLLLA